MRTTKFNSFIAAAVAFALSTTAALAQSISLNAPMQAASLHSGNLAMVVYYMEMEDHYQVVATYVSQDAPQEPARIKMALSDNDATRFGMPGHPGIIYAFSRSGETVNVSAELVGKAMSFLPQ